jgi:hypothetical protein
MRGVNQKGIAEESYRGELKGGRQKVSTRGLLRHPRRIPKQRNYITEKLL